MLEGKEVWGGISSQTKDSKDSNASSFAQAVDVGVCMTKEDQNKHG